MRVTEQSAGEKKKIPSLVVVVGIVQDSGHTQPKSGRCISLI